jgi:hypothetical protein
MGFTEYRLRMSGRAKRSGGKIRFISGKKQVFKKSRSLCRTSLIVSKLSLDRRSDCGLGGSEGRYRCLLFSMPPMKIKDITEWSGRWSTPLGTMDAHAPVADAVLVGLSLWGIFIVNLVVECPEGK